MDKIKNCLLFLVFIIGQIPTVFYNSTQRLNLSVFIERSTRLDFFFLYYSDALNFLILAFCVHFNKGIDKRISIFILIIMFLDFVHLFLFAMQGYGMSKIGIAILIYYVIRWLK